MERIKFMSEEQTIMEKLFKTLDEKAKVLNEQNGQSFIENLGLAMEDVYSNKRELQNKPHYKIVEKHFSSLI